MSKPAATWHPRRTPPWICQWCGASFPVVHMCVTHEATKCDLRPEAK